MKRAVVLFMVIVPLAVAPAMADGAQRVIFEPAAAAIGKADRASGDVRMRASRAFPHGHPLHICMFDGEDHPWLAGEEPQNPWSSVTGASAGSDWPGMSDPTQ